MTKSICLSCLVLISNSLLSQISSPSISTDFWVAFSARTFSSSSNTDIYLQATSREEGSMVYMDLIHLNWSITFFLEPFSSQTVKVPIDLVSSNESDVILNTGMHVTSSSPIQLMTLTRKNVQSDGTELLPTSLLGTTYMILTRETAQGSSRGPETIIVATEDQTEINVNPTSELEDSLNIVPFSVILDKGQVYQFMTENDATGTEISSCKPIAVFTGNPFIAIPGDLFECHCSDRIIAQMPPVEYWGSEYCFTPIIYPNEDYESRFAIKVLAQQDSTIVYLHNVPHGPLYKGESIILENLYRAGTLQSNKPILAAYFIYGGRCVVHSSTEFNGDPSMLLLPPTNLWLDTLAFQVPDYDEGVGFNEMDDFINIIIHSEDEPFFELSYPIFDGTFKSFDTTDEYVWTNLYIAKGSTYTITAPNGVWANIYGIGNYESYHFNLPYQLERRDLIFDFPKSACINEVIEFDFCSYFKKNPTTLQWDFGDGSTSTELKPIHQFSEPGFYTIELTIETPYCKTVTAYQEIEIIGTLTPNFAIEGEVQVNPLNLFTYIMPTLENSEYSWTVENGQIIEEYQDSIWVQWDNTSTGQISVIETTKEGCIGNTITLPVIISEFNPGNSCFENITAFPNPTKTNIDISLLSDGGQEFQLIVINTLGQLIKEETFSTSAGQNFMLVDLTELSSGLYFIRFTNGNCEDLVKVVKMK